MSRPTLYDSIKQTRQVQRQAYQRVMLSGYFNEQEVKKDSINVQQFIKDSLKKDKNVRSYYYTKGVFYVQILQSKNINTINTYLLNLKQLLVERPTLMNVIRVNHQTYQSCDAFFKDNSGDNNPQPGPILVQTQKTEQQIQDRMFEIHELFIDGARKRRQNPNHKIGNMIVLSNDDMAILTSKNFMNLEEYLEIYAGQIHVDRQEELNYPLPPSFFDIMEFLEIQNYQTYRKK